MTNTKPTRTSITATQTVTKPTEPFHFNPPTPPPASTRYRDCPANAVRVLNKNFPHVMYNVLKSVPPNAQLVNVSSGVSRNASNTPFGEKTWMPGRVSSVSLVPRVR